VDNLTSEEHDLLERVRAKPELETFFFQKLKGLKWLNQLIEKGYYAPEKLPGPVESAQEGFYSIPYWAPIGYLLAVAPEIKSRHSDAEARIVLDIIRRVSAYAIEHRTRNYRVWWEFAKILRCVPPVLVDEADLEFIDYWLDDPFDRSQVADEIGKWIVALLLDDSPHAKSLALRTSELLFRLRQDGEASEEGALRIDNWAAEQLIARLAPVLGRTLHVPGVEVFHAPLVALLAEQDGKRDSWSHMWRPAIEEHSQNVRRESAEQLLIVGFRDSVDALVESDAKGALNFFRGVLEGTLQTPKRVAIYTLAQHFEPLRDLLPDVLVEQHFRSNFRHELWHLLKRRYPAFDAGERDIVRGLIESRFIRNETGKVVEEPTANLQATWYAAIKDHGSVEKSEYTRLVAAAGGAPDYPDFASYHMSGHVEHRSLYSTEELLALEPRELAERLRSYEPDDNSFLPEHDSRGLAKTFQQVLAADPMKYFYHLSQFETLRLDFVHAVFEAFQGLWSANGALPWTELWERIMAFAESLTESSSTLWNVASKPASEQPFLTANKHWIVADIARVIEQGTKEDSHVMPDILLPRAQTLLLALLDRSPGSSFKPEDDAIFIAINSDHGNCVEALFNLALRRCRLADSVGNEHQSVWERELEPHFDARLTAASSDSFEFAVLAVNYLPNLLYLSADWVHRNIERLFWVADETMWLCAMQGYAQIARVQRTIYDYLKRSGQFLRALDDERLKERVHEKIIQNIVFGFIADFESLQDADSLIAKLIERRQRDEISHLTWFIWTLRESDSRERLSHKIHLLWPRLLAIVDVSTRDGRLLASRLCIWLDLVEEISAQNLEWIRAVAPYADENHNSYGFLESLARLSEKHPNEVFEIWKALLTGSRAAYPPEAIATIFKRLVALGSEGKRKANEIASAYVLHGNRGPYESLESLL
jgi:hypothetical protein